MELRKVIYDLRYKPTFAWIDKKGSIIDVIKSSKCFTNLGFSEARIDANQDDANIRKTLTLELNKFSGLIEKETINLEDIKEILRIGETIFGVMDLNKETIIRIGIRFHFINHLEFRIANDFFIQTLAPEFRKIVGGKEFTDSAIVPVTKYDNHSIKFMLGPLKKEEYPRYFEKIKLISYDEGYLFDIDYFSTDFHSLRIDKFTEEAFNNVGAIVNNLQKMIEDYVNNSKTKK